MPRNKLSKFDKSLREQISNNLKTIVRKYDTVSVIRSNRHTRINYFWILCNAFNT